MNLFFAPKDILAVLKNARLFTQFSDSQLNQLIAFSAVESYPQGATILLQGAANDKVFILLSGEVSVYCDGEFILSLRRQGDLVGEMSVITKQPTSATVRADTPVILFAVSSANIDQSADAEIRSILYKIFLDILTEKLTLTTQQVKGFQATTEELIIKRQELAKSEDDRFHKEAILQSVLGSMSDGLVVTEENGRLLHVNPVFRRMVGGIALPLDFSLWPTTIGLYKKDETTCYSVDDLPMIKIQRGQQVDSEEIFVKNPQLPDGIWLQASSRHLTPQDGGKSRGAVVVFRDFTKKKLEEKALIRAKEDAEAMAKAKSDFLAVMSHELRTPLNSIQGMSELLKTTPLTVEQQEYVETIKTGGEQLLTLIRNILDFSNLDSGHIRPEIKPYSFTDSVKEIIAGYRTQAGKKGIEVVMDLSPKIPEQWLGYERGMRQILRNLIDNAIKFSTGGTVTITAGIQSPGDTVPALHLVVSDMGIGIAEKDMATLFQPFSQVDSSSSRRFGGTGIGLGVCRKFAELMNGRIWAESSLGKGSSFHFVLPLPNDVPAASKRVPKEGSNPLKLDSSFAERYALKILVVEDNPLNQKLILKVLHKLGYHPQLANTGLEAVDTCRQEDYDLILMDLQMPDMDGMEAARVISREKGPQERPIIIALTANVSATVEANCYDAGMSGYLTKPLNIQKLAQLLIEWS